MYQASLFQETYSGELVAQTQYGSIVKLHQLANGQYRVVEIEEGKEDYALIFDSYEEAKICFNHFIIDINSNIELKEDGSIGYYPQNVAVEIDDNQPTLFDFAY